MWVPPMDSEFLLENKKNFQIRCEMSLTLYITNVSIFLDPTQIYDMSSCCCYAELWKFSRFSILFGTPPTGSHFVVEFQSLGATAKPWDAHTKIS